jgi:hypothetical protein
MNRLACAAALIVAAVSATSAQKPEATSLSGTALTIPATIPNRQKLEADLLQAQKTYAANRDARSDSDRHAGIRGGELSPRDRRSRPGAAGVRKDRRGQRMECVRLHRC